MNDTHQKQSDATSFNQEPVHESRKKFINTESTENLLDNDSEDDSVKSSKPNYEAKEKLLTKPQGEEQQPQPAGFLPKNASFESIENSFDTYSQTEDSENDVLSVASTENRTHAIDYSKPISKSFEVTNQHPMKLKLKKEKLIGYSKSHLSPSEEWKIKKDLKEKNRLPRAASRAIRSGLKIRQHLHDLKRSSTDNVNTYYLQTVNSGSVENVKALFDFCKIDRSYEFDKNFIDHRDYDALRIAIANKDLRMCKFLLNHRVDLRHSLLFAIDGNFFEGIEAILNHDVSKDLCVKKQSYYFSVGLTPMILAAHKNDYKILKLLYAYGHRMRESMTWWEGINYAFESANERKMLCTAIASPAHITLYCEENKLNPMSFCLNLIKDFRNDGAIEQEVIDFYTNLEIQIEDLMCRLLDQIQSSEELAQLFEYEFNAYWNPKHSSFGHGATPLALAQSRLGILDKASEHHLTKFVTHQNSQLALSYVRYRYTSFLRDKSQFKRVLYGVSISLLFPLWSLLYLVAPHTKLGGIITLPNVSYLSHLASDITFIFLLIISVATKSPDREFLGAVPTPVEWLIFLWILGKWVQEIKQLQTRGLKKYMKDGWNYIDMFQLILFATAIVLRLWDFIAYANVPNRPRRPNWLAFEPRVLASGFTAWAYIFVFLRILSLSRTNRTLGPLQVSVAQMLFNVVQFFTTFGLILFSFALAMTELFWYYGTTQGESVVCIEGTNGTNCKNTFTAIGPSLETLFWAIFGYLNLTEIPNTPQLRFVYWAGLSLLWVYHVVAIIILINTLIAMMAKSFEVISENKDMEWKFHRTVVWIRFVRREATRPPPMNLLPNPYAVYKQLKRFKNWMLYTVFRRTNKKAEREKRMRMGQLVYNSRFHLGIPVQDLRDLEMAAFQEKEILKKHLSLKISFLLLKRYKFRELLHANK